MAKHVLYLIMDTLSTEYLEKIPNKESLFLLQDSEHKFYANNVFSQAPFTEGAFQNILGGQNCMDFGGYMHGMKSCKNTIFNYLSQKGIKTYFPTIYPSFNTEYLMKGISDPYFYSLTEQQSFENVRVKYYADLLAHKKLNDNDIQTFSIQLSSIFTDYINSIRRMLNKDKSMELIDKYYDYSICKCNLSFAENEFQKMKKDVKKYCIKFLEDYIYGNNDFLNLPSMYKKQDFASSDYKKWFRKNTKRLLSSYKRKFRWLNIKNDILPRGYWKNVLFDVCHAKGFAKKKEVIVTALLPFIDKNVDDFLGPDFDKYRKIPSAYTTFNHYLSWLEQNKNDNTFAYIHLDECHPPISFLSSDIENKDIVLEEIKTAYDCLKKIKRTDSGLFSYYLAMSYFDLKFKNFVKELENKKMLDDLTIIVSGDHGFSFFQSPVRDKEMVHFYRESFRVPVFVFGPDICSKKDSNLKYTKAIPCSICKLFGVPNDINFYNKSIFEENEDFLIMEYGGPGCPDIQRRGLFYSYYDGCIMFSAHAMLGKKILINDIYEIYNLKEDPKQIINLKENISNMNLQTALDNLNNHHLMKDNNHA